MPCDPKVLNRLKRAEGQLRGITNMLEQERDCKDVLVQLTAVRSSIDRIIKLVGVQNLMTLVDGEDHEAIETAVDLLMKM